MSVDKFGHYSFNNSYPIKRDVPKVLGFFFDNDRNLDLQNKNIKNLAAPTEETDAVNKVYLQTQVNDAKEFLKADLYNTLTQIETQFFYLRDKISDIYDFLVKITRDNGKEVSR